MTLVLVLASVSLGAAGQVLLKLGAARPVYSASDLITTLLTPLTLAGLLIYFASATLWIALLSRVQLSYAYPLLALNYAAVVGISAWLLHEPVSPYRWIGVLLIIAGFAVVATS